MNDLRKEINEQIKLLENLINEQKSKEEIDKERKKLDLLLDKYLKDM